MQALYRLLLLFCLCGCTSEKVHLRPVSAETYFSIQVGGSPTQLQIALTQSERNRGLMYRDTLPKNHGMLFLFEQPGKQSFWMRNTQIPLDLAYFDANGRLLEIHSLYPYDENPVNSNSSEVLIAIETNQGWFARNAIRPGAQLDLEALRQAVNKRGYSSKRFSL